MTERLKIPRVNQGVVKAELRKLRLRMAELRALLQLAESQKLIQGLGNGVVRGTRSRRSPVNGVEHHG